MAQKMHYRGHPRPFCKHSLPGAPQAARTGGTEEKATWKVGEGKHCPLWPCQESLPSNCPRETRLRTLSWLVTQLPAPKCPSCPLIFPRAPVCPTGNKRVIHGVWASHTSTPEGAAAQDPQAAQRPLPRSPKAGVPRLPHLSATPE